MLLTKDMLADLSAGATFLATGGGGDPYLTYLTACQALDQYGPARLIPVGELPDDAAIVAIGAVGAPTTSLELLPSLEDSIKALSEYRRLTGRRVDAVVSFEIGGSNSLIPIIAAAANGIPVIDGDGMGRALPEAQMMTYAIAGHHPTPAVAVDYAGNAVLIDCENVEAYENELRDFTMRRGGSITSVEFWMSGADLKACIVPGTVSLSIALGRILRGGNGNASEVSKLLEALFANSIYGQYRLLYSGIVADMSTRVVEGFDVGRAIVESSVDGEPAMEITIKNEYLTAQVGTRLLATVPDLITILDFETAQPINAERLRYGQRVSVIGIGCPDHFRTARALCAVGPRAFGFPFDFIPIETLV